MRTAEMLGNLTYCRGGWLGTPGVTVDACSIPQG